MVVIGGAVALTLGAAAAIVYATQGGDGSRSPAPAAARPASPGMAAVGVEDVASAVGLSFRHGAFRFGVTDDPVAMMGGGLCWLDYDDDGWLDLFVVNSYDEREVARLRREGGIPRTALFRNVRGRFVDVGAASGASIELRGNGCVAGDLDLDGHTDLYVTAVGTSALLWNNGDGTFSEGAEAAGVDASGWHTGAAVGDVDGDGRPDLFVAGYADLNAPLPDAAGGFPTTFAGVRDRLYLGSGQSRGRTAFREVGVVAGLESSRFGYGLGARFSDFDRDGDLDLYVANDLNPNRLYENVPWPGGPEADPAGLGFRFDERAAAAGVADPNAGMGVAAADWDGDGRSDLFVSNARGQEHAVYRSRPLAADAPSFFDARDDVEPLAASERAFTGWGASLADIDLDTDLDLLLANGAVPVRNLRADAEGVQILEGRSADGLPGSFRDASRTVGLHQVRATVGRGLAAADYDNDGDMDAAIGSIGGPVVLLGTTTTAGNWLEVEVEGFHPGAEVTAVLRDGRELRREVYAGGSYLSSDDPRCHFGLGGATSVRELVVRFPGGAEARLADVAANQFVVVEAPG